MLAICFLFLGLSSPHFEVREASQSTLIRLADRHPREHGPVVGLLVGATQCPEARARGLRVVAAYDRWRVLQYVPKTIPLWPICDSYPGPEAHHRDKTKLDPWFRLAPEDKVQLKPPAWTRYREATEKYARHLLITGSTEAEVDALLLRMWEIERACGSDCGAVLPAAGLWRGYIRPGVP